MLPPEIEVYEAFSSLCWFESFRFFTIFHPRTLWRIHKFPRSGLRGCQWRFFYRWKIAHLARLRKTFSRFVFTNIRGITLTQSEISRKEKNLVHMSNRLPRPMNHSIFPSSPEYLSHRGKTEWKSLSTARFTRCLPFKKAIKPGGKMRFVYCVSLDHVFVDSDSDK